MRLRMLLGFLVVAFSASGVSAQEPLTAKKTKDTIEIHSGSKLLTIFRFGDWAKPIFYPMNTPKGIPVTRAWPMEKGHPAETTDHPHQKSAWFTHGDLIVEGMPAPLKIKGIDGHDFWSENVGHGKIVAVEVSEPKTVNGGVSFTVKNEWRSHDGKKILDENRVYHIVPVKGGWLLTMDSNILSSVAKVIFGDTKEGSFGIRVNDEFTEKTGKGKLTNAEGMVGEKKVWGLISNWCDYSGTVGDKAVGITILADPSNPYPTAWHSRGYGLMAANPFGREHAGFPSMKGKKDLVTLNKGDQLPLRYGILVHDGNVEEAGVGQVYQTFVELGKKK